jgi:seryl-tRNA(Sec) selenium transferase
VVVETRDDVKKTVNPQTAMMHFTNFAYAAGEIKVEQWVKLAHEYKIPAFIDAAADTPPVSHLWDFANMGYDLIAFSGGKAIRGPQCAGILLGKRDLVANALLNNSPHEDTLGRSQKVGKEEIVGMVKALESYLSEDHAALSKEWQRRLDAISAEITRVPGVTTSFFTPDVANHVPHMKISWDQKVVLTVKDAVNALRNGKPAIVLDSSETALSMNSFMLQPDEEKIIAAHLAQLLKAHSA